MTSLYWWSRLRTFPIVPYFFCFAAFHKLEHNCKVVKHRRTPNEWFKSLMLLANQVIFAGTLFGMSQLEVSIEKLTAISATFLHCSLYGCYLSYKFIVVFLIQCFFIIASVCDWLSLFLIEPLHVRVVGNALIFSVSFTCLILLFSLFLRYLQ